MWHDEVTFQCADGHDRLPCAQPRGDVRLFSPGQRRGVLPEHGFCWPLVTSSSPWALGSCSLCALYVPGLPPPPRCLTKPQDSPHLTARSQPLPCGFQGLQTGSIGLDIKGLVWH